LREKKFRLKNNNALLLWRNSFDFKSRINVNVCKALLGLKNAKVLTKLQTIGSFLVSHAWDNVGSRDPSWEITISLRLFQPSSSVVHCLSCWPSSAHSVGQVFFPASSFILWSSSRLRFRTGVSFSINYVSPWEDVITAHVLNATMYADDSLYIIMRQSNRATALKDLTLCIQDIMSWSVFNMLKCNPKKTAIIHSSSHFSPAEPIPSIKVGDCPISLSNEVKNLGVTVDRHLTFKTHINNICFSASRSIRHIGKIRNLLSRSNTERLIYAFVSSNWITATAFLTAYPPMT